MASSEALKQQMEQIKQARALARSFGAPYVDWHFLASACAICILAFALYSCALQPLYLNFVQPLKSDLLCLILNESEGRKQVAQMVARVTEDLETSDLHRNEPQTPDKTIRHQLAVLASGGHLEPANRRPERIVLLCKCCLGLCSAGWSFLLGYMVSSMFVVPRLLSGLHRMHFEPMDLLVLGEGLLLFAMIGCCLEMYYGIMTISTVDQVLTVTALIRDFRQCIRLNEFAAVTERKDEADRSLLVLIVKFRLFRLQTKASLPFNGQHLFVQAKLGAFTVLVANGLAIHLNVHFLILTLVFLVTFLAVVIIFWVPTCHMHSRCEDLYRALCSLNAHIIRSKLAYNPQLADMLRKELMHPDKLLDDFACQFLGIRFTYRNLMKYLFFYNLGIILTYFQYRNKEKPTSLLALL